MPIFQHDSVLNGNDAISVLKKDGLIFRTDPVEEFYVFTIRDIVAQQKKQLTFPAPMRGWYQLHCVHLGLSMDADPNVVDSTYITNSRTIRCLLRGYENNAIKYAEAFALSNGRWSASALYFNASIANDFYCDGAVIEMTWFCLPLQIINGGRLA